MATIPDSYRDLLDGQVATFGTIDPDGRPQLTLVWFLAEDDGTLALSLNVTRQKVKNLRRNQACSLVLLDPSNPYRYIEVRGDAELEPDDDYSFAKKVGQKYGADVKSFDQPGDTRVKVTLRPTRVNAVAIGG